MKGCLIKDIKDNQNVEGLFMVREASRGETKNGSPFLSLTLMDASGELSGRVWDNADRYLPHCKPGAIINLRGQSQSYKGVVQLRVDYLEKGEVAAEEMALFIPATTGDLKEMLAELTRLAKSITNSPLRDLTLAFLTDRHLTGLFKKAPAAKYMHHAYLGGLLEHTLGVTRLAEAVATLYPAIDRSLLLAGAITHDLGKLSEFDYDNYPYDYSDRGRLVGHMVLGIELLRKLAGAIPDFPEETMTRLQHLILSHHGEHAFGSPALPMMLEAFVLHFIDNLDSKVGYISGLGKKREEPGYHWSEFQRNLERFLYVRNPDLDRAEGFDANGKEIDHRQGILWKA